MVPNPRRRRRTSLSDVCNPSTFHDCVGKIQSLATQVDIGGGGGGGAWCSHPLTHSSHSASSTDISDRRMAHRMDSRRTKIVDAPSDEMMAALRAWLHKLHLGNSVNSVCPSDVKLLQEGNHDISVFCDGVFLSQVIAALLRENKECVKQVLTHRTYILSRL